jgi:hypothetical protein
MPLRINTVGTILLLKKVSGSNQFSPNQQSPNHQSPNKYLLNRYSTNQLVLVQNEPSGNRHQIGHETFNTVRSVPRTVPIENAMRSTCSSEKTCAHTMSDE